MMQCMSQCRATPTSASSAFTPALLSVHVIPKKVLNQEVTPCFYSEMACSSPDVALQAAG